MTGYAAKKEGLGIGGPNQILITGGKDDNLTQQLLDVSATNGAVINSQVRVGSLFSFVLFFLYQCLLSFFCCKSSLVESCIVQQLTNKLIPET